MSQWTLLYLALFLFLSACGGTGNTAQHTSTAIANTPDHQASESNSVGTNGADAEDKTSSPPVSSTASASSQLTVTAIEDISPAEPAFSLRADETATVDKTKESVEKVVIAAADAASETKPEDTTVIVQSETSLVQSQQVQSSKEALALNTTTIAPPNNGQVEASLNLENNTPLVTNNNEQTHELIIENTADTSLTPTTYFQGNIVDAMTGQALDDVVIYRRKGKGVLAGVAEDTRTSATGLYQFEVSDATTGIYSLEIVKTGYTTLYREQTASSSQQLSTIALSPLIHDQSIRVILTWDNQPVNLNAQLSTEIDGTSYRIDENNRGAISTLPYVHMSAVRSNNPTLTEKSQIETITIHNPLPNISYHYRVNNIPVDNTENPQTTLSSSNARVEMYSSEGLLKTYKVPSTTLGNTWEVFDYKG